MFNARQFLSALEFVDMVEGTVGEVVIHDMTLAYDYWIDDFELSTLEIKLYDGLGDKKSLLTSRMGPRDWVLRSMRGLFKDEIARDKVAHEAAMKEAKDARH